MFIPVSELQSDWNVSAIGVLHVGAHNGEEANQYEGASWSPVTWIEAQPELVTNLQKTLDPRVHKVIKAAVYDKNDVNLLLNISSNSQSSSLLNFGTHRLDYPEITMVTDIAVATKRIDALINETDMPNFINLDIQGLELKALFGLGKLIESVKFIYTEVNRRDVYEGCAKVDEIDQYLSSQGFRRVTTRWQWIEGWGDALYVRNDEFKQSLVQVIRSFFRQVAFYKPQTKQILLNLFRNPNNFFIKNNKQNFRS